MRVSQALQGVRINLALRLNEHTTHINMVGMKTLWCLYARVAGN